MEKLERMKPATPMMNGSGAFGGSSPGIEPVWGGGSGDPKWDMLRTVGALIAGIAVVVMN